MQTLTDFNVVCKYRLLMCEVAETHAWILVDLRRRAEELLGEQRSILERHLKCRDSCTERVQVGCPHFLPHFLFRKKNRRGRGYSSLVIVARERARVALFCLQQQLVSDSDIFSRHL
jgi:hypothetical protein